MDTLITQEQLETQHGSGLLRELLDHDGDNVADADKVALVLAQATGLYRRIVGRAWPNEEAVRNALAEDPSLLADLGYLALGYAGRSKSSFLDEQGRGRYDGVANDAETRLRRLVSGHDRSAAEQVPGVGPPATISGHSTGRAFVFADSGGRGGRGGQGGF